MSTTPVDYIAQIVDEAYPNVNVAAVTPAVDDVALLLRTRAVTRGGGLAPTFTDDGTPSRADVAGLISQAIVVVLEQISEDVPSYVYPRIRQAVTLQAAILVENSFFLNQVRNGQSNAAGYQTLLNTIMGNLAKFAGDAKGSRKRVGSVIVRSTMTDYDEVYPLPAPRQVIAFRTPEQEGVTPGPLPSPTPVPVDPTTLFSNGLDGGGASTTLLVGLDGGNAVSSTPDALVILDGGNAQEA